MPRTFEMVEIGVAHTPLTTRFQAPCQPAVQGGAEARIELHPEYRDGLADLDGFDRVWLLYTFHLNQGWRSRVKPPRGDRTRGLFATRGPHRPSSIGLTAARLLRVDDGCLWVSEMDLLDQTPILDIKPYIPRVDAYPSARAGWVDAVDVDEQAAR